jgi:MBG domain (YGX type)
VTGNYNDQSGTVENTINMVNVVCEVIPYEITYDGTPHTATGFCTGILGELLEGLDTSGTTHTNAGIYTDTWTFTDVTGNYSDTIGTVNDTIARADATCEVNPYDLTYDGDPHNATGFCTGVLGEFMEGLDLSGTTHTNSGSYTDTWTFTDASGNYNDASGGITDMIAKAEATCTINGFTGIYNMASHGASGTCTGLGGEEPGVLDLGESFMNVPGGTASWTFTGNGNYNDQSGEVDIVIDPADASCLVDGYTGVYDAVSHGASGTCTGLGGEEPGVLNLGESFKDVPGGTAHWSFTGNGNYNNQSGEVDIVIDPADASCLVDGYTGVYDAVYHGASGTCTGVGGEEPGVLDLGESFMNVPGGIAHWSFTDNGNYNDQSGEVEIEISKANPSCEVTAYSLEFDRESHTASGACLGVDNNPLAGLDFSGTTHAAIGIYTDDPWAFTDLSGNYNESNGTVNDEITLRYITVVADAKSKIYGQADPLLTFQVTVGSLLGEDAFSGELIRQPGENIGTYAILQGSLLLPEYYQISYEGASFTINGFRYSLPLVHRFDGVRELPNP